MRGALRTATMSSDLSTHLTWAQLRLPLHPLECMMRGVARPHFAIMLCPTGPRGIVMQGVVRPPSTSKRPPVRSLRAPTASDAKGAGDGRRQTSQPRSHFTHDVAARAESTCMREQDEGRRQTSQHPVTSHVRRCGLGPPRRDIVGGGSREKKRTMTKTWR